MKHVDRIVFVVFILALVVISFFTQCKLDIYFIAFGFIVATAVLVYKFINAKKEG